jgi:hypothetical protein
VKVRLAILTILLAFPLAAFGHAEIFFPKSVSPAELPNTGFVLLNVDPTTATVHFYLLGTNGSVVASPQPVQIPPRGQLAKLGSELFPNVTTAGWVYVITDTEGMQAFWLNYDEGLTFLDGAEAFQYETIGAQQIIPLVSADTELSVISMNGVQVPVTVRLFGVDGEVAPAFTRGLPAAGVFQTTASQMFPGTDFLQARYMRISTPGGPVASTALVKAFQVPFESVVVNGVNAGSLTEMVFPHIVTGGLGGATYSTTIGVTNLSNSPQVLTITFDPDDGAPMTVTRSITGNGALRETAANLFQLAPAFAGGWIRVTGTAPLTGFASYADTVGGGLAIVPAAAPQSNLFFSHIANGPPHWQTGIALLNLSPAAASVEIYAVNPSGTLIGAATIDIGAGERIARVIHDLIPETRGVNGGYVYVRTINGIPLHGIELFYTEDLKVLSNVAAGKLTPGVPYVPPSR